MPERYMGLICLAALFALILIFTIGPEEKKVTPQQAYNIGDIVYLKLDNNKAQITHYNNIHKYYTLRVKTEAGYQDIICKELEFTVKAEKE